MSRARWVNYTALELLRVLAVLYCDPTSTEKPQIALAAITPAGTFTIRPGYSQASTDGQWAPDGTAEIEVSNGALVDVVLLANRRLYANVAVATGIKRFLAVVSRWLGTSPFIEAFRGNGWRGADAGSWLVIGFDLPGAVRR